MLITRKLRRQTTIANEALYCTSFGSKDRDNLSYVAGLGAGPSIVATVRGDDGREYRVRLTADDIDAINRARHVLYGGAEYVWPPAWLPDHLRNVPVAADSEPIAAGDVLARDPDGSYRKST